jgi:hypothetical protein
VVLFTLSSHGYFVQQINIKEQDVALQVQKQQTGYIHCYGFNQLTFSEITKTEEPLSATP